MSTLQYTVFRCANALHLPFLQIGVELGWLKRSSDLSLSTRINPQDGVQVKVRSLPSFRAVDSPPTYYTWWFFLNYHESLPNFVESLLLSLHVPVSLFYFPQPLKTSISGLTHHHAKFPLHILLLSFSSAILEFVRE